jgi:hypothetical protein
VRAWPAKDAKASWIASDEERRIACFQAELLTDGFSALRTNVLGQRTRAGDGTPSSSRQKM